MKVDPRAIVGIERKIARAEQHLGVLYGEMEAWSAGQPWGLFPEVHDEGRKHFWRLRLAKPIPIDWAIILGEAVHNLRSALDQSVYWLSVDWTRKEVPFCSFPVYRTKAMFYERERRGTRRGDWTYRSGMNKIRGIGPGPQAFIEALQPYPQRYRRAYCLDLQLIHDLWNQDKHRLVHLWGLRFGDAEVRLEKKLIQDCVVGLDRRLLQDGAIVIKITSDPPHAEVKVQGEISGMLSISGGKRAGGPSIGLLDMQRTVVEIILKLTNALGHQDDPINLTAWTAR